jgi:hypothetical protein
MWFLRRPYLHSCSINRFNLASLQRLLRWSFPTALTHHPLSKNKAMVCTECRNTSRYSPHSLHWVWNWRELRRRSTLWRPIVWFDDFDHSRFLFVTLFSLLASSRNSSRNSDRLAHVLRRHSVMGPATSPLLRHPTPRSQTPSRNPPTQMSQTKF